MILKAPTIVCAGILLLGFAARCDAPRQKDWTHYVRIGAYGLQGGDAEKIVRDAEKSHVFGIEVDNDITGRYESYLDPSSKLKAIHEVAEQAHKVGNKAFVYIAGTECITANADKSKHSVLKDHPDWLQRKVNGEPAVFTSGAAFWISPGDEDVWISPFAVEWRNKYMQRVREIAATGIDGIYVDIPYWMTHFDGWENTWASFDDYTVAAFKKSSGIDARHDLKLGDFSDPRFRTWIDFRISTLTDFIREIRKNARSVNSSIMIITDIYPGIEEEATRVGADVYEMYDAADAIAHEYEFGAGEHMATSRTQLDWFLYQAGMLTFRAFAQGKATWILNYSWDGDKIVGARDAMKNLAMSQIMVGANFWDAPGHSMAGSNDQPTRAQLFQWIGRHESTFYGERSPVNPVGVYFSPKSRDYQPREFLPSYRGLLLLLLQTHREFQVVTPRTLAHFSGKVLALPNVSGLDDSEKVALRAVLAKGTRLVISGSEATGIEMLPCISRFVNCPAKKYLQALEEDFVAGSTKLPDELLSAIELHPDLVVEAPSTMATNMASVDGTPHVFLANFGGLVPGHVGVPTTETTVRLSIPANRKSSLRFLPFLGEVQTIRGKISGERLVFVLPPIERGAVISIEAAE